MKLHTILVASLVGVGLAVSSHAVPPIPDNYKIGGFAIGCQAWSFNRYTVFEAIEKTAQTGAKVIEFYPGQRLSPEHPEIRFDHNVSDDVIAMVKAQLKKYGIRPVAYGVVGIPKDEAQARKVFEFAKKLGIHTITTESVESIDTIEKLVKEYDICVGYHNHPRRPNNPNYKNWDPRFIANLVKGRDRRIGAAADTGHWLRSGLDPLECLRILRGRIVGMHLKDLNRKGPGAHDVPYGTGVGHVKKILDELRAQGFDGPISVEYEYHWTNNVPEIAQCIGFVRGYGAVIQDLQKKKGK